MSKRKKVPVFVDEEAHKALTKWAGKNEMHLGEAAERLMKVAYGRLGALVKYSKQQKLAAAKAARGRRPRRSSSEHRAGVQ